MSLLKQSSAAQPLPFLMVDSSDHITGKLGLSPTVVISKNGATFSSPSGAVTEIGNGWYKVAGHSTDTNTLGPLILHASAVGADPFDTMYDVVVFDPQDVAQLGLTNLDATVSSRSTYTGADTPGTATLLARVPTFPANFTAQSITPGGLVDITQIAADKVWSTVSRTITAGTNIILPENSITAASIASSALNGKGDWLLSSSYTAPSNLTAAQIAAGVWQDTTAGDFTVAGSVGKSIMNGVPLGTGLTINGYTGNTPQSGDAFALIGVSGVGLTSLGDPRISNLDVAVSTRSTYAGGAVASVTAAVTLPTMPTDWITSTGMSPSAVAEIADAVWDEVASGHLTAGTTGEAIVSASSSGDPWGTAIPGAYAVGTAGYILGTNLNATVASRSTYEGGDTSGTTTLLSRVPTFPANFSAFAISVGGVAKADVETIKTQTVTCASGVTVLASVGTATPSAAQSGDAFARIGAAGAGLTSIGDTRIANLDTTVSSRSTFSGGAVASVTAAVTLPVIPTGWITAAGIAASALNGKGDWNIGKTGYTLTQAFPANFAAMSLTAGGLVTLAAVTHTGAVIPTVSTVTGLNASNLDATVSSRSTYNGGDTSGITTLLARIPAALTITSGKVDINDKTGFVLSSGGLSSITAWTVNITGNLLGSVNSVVNAPWTLLG
jgi:hypothetical protein